MEPTGPAFGRLDDKLRNTHRLKAKLSSWVSLEFIGVAIARNAFTAVPTRS